MNREQWLTLPGPVRDFIWDNIEDVNKQIIDQFALNEEQVDFILDLQDRLFLKRADVLELPQLLTSLPQADKVDLRLLALAMAEKVLWPLQDYLVNVDRLILRLGGKVPKIQHLKDASQNQQRTFPETTRGMIRQLMEEYEDFKDLRLSAKKIYGLTGNFLTPTVDNWLKDYVHFLGAGYHNSLQRAQYLAKAPNALNLSEKEKESLRNVLLSYDDNLILDWQFVDGMLVAQEQQADDIETKEQKVDINTSVKNLEEHLKQMETVFLPTDFLLSEAGGDLLKLRDILWQALGLQDRAKILTCLKIFIEKKLLDNILIEDSRLRNILKRFISVRYGNALASWLDNNQDKLLNRRLFLEMVLSEKMQLDEDEATVAAFYLTNIWPKSGQIVYLDQASGRLKWRGLQVVKNQLLWIE